MAEDDEGAKKAEVIDPTDVLNDWLVTRVVSTFRCPREKAVGMCNNEASRAAIETFYQKEDVQRLVVTTNPDPTAVRARDEATRGARSPPASPLDAIAKIETLGASTPPGRPAAAGGDRPIRASSVPSVHPRERSARAAPDPSLRVAPRSALTPHPSSSPRLSPSLRPRIRKTPEERRCAS